MVKIVVTRNPDRSPVNVELSLERVRANFPENALAMHRRAGIILKDAGVHPVLMLQPLLILQRDREEMVGIERELFDFNVDSYRPNVEEFYRLAVPYLRDTESQMAREIGASYLDLTPVFDSVAGQAFTDYAHLTPLGNEVVAEAILEHLLAIACKDLEVSDDRDLINLRRITEASCAAGAPAG